MRTLNLRSDLSKRGVSYYILPNYYILHAKEMTPTDENNAILRVRVDKDYTGDMWALFDYIRAESKKFIETAA